MGIARGRDVAAVVTREFEFSKSAFLAGKIEQGDRAYYSFKAVTARDFARYQDEQMLLHSGIGAGKVKSQDLEFRSNVLGLDLLKRYLCGLQSYYLAGPGGELVPVVWPAGGTDAAKEAVLDQLLGEDRSEIRDAILGFSAIDETSEKN
jgi:hypothetical protein